MTVSENISTEEEHPSAIPVPFGEAPVKPTKAASARVKDGCVCFMALLLRNLHACDLAVIL